MSDNYKPQAQGVCGECDSMWREYAHAMAEHLNIQLEVYMATTGRDWAKEASLNDVLADAAKHRDQARNAIRAHEQVRHAKAAGK